MIKTYTLDDGFSFQTITIPKGALLFRGIQFSDLTPREHISEFVGHRLCVSPTKNVYFYPVPYVAMAVNSFNVHILYTTNYPIELLLLVRPSTGFKPDGQEGSPGYSRIITICDKLSATNKCGHPMSSDDPCFTDFFLEKFPHILGYIGLDAGDVDSFLGRYKAMIREGLKNEIGQIVSVLLSNSRDITGIPEIVIHPLHLRRNKTVRVKQDFNDPSRHIQSIIMNRAKWNYTPLLYISASDIFSLKDLLNDDTKITALRNAEDSIGIKGNKLFNNLSKVMIGLSSTNGYTIDGCRYTIKIDLRTGFYQIIHDGISCNNTTRKMRTAAIELFENEAADAINIDTLTRSLQYSASTLLPAKVIRDVKDTYLMDINEEHVNKFLHSFLAYTVFERSQTITKYKLEEVFPRPDLPRISHLPKKQLAARKTWRVSRSKMNGRA